MTRTLRGLYEDSTRTLRGLYEESPPKYSHRLQTSTHTHLRGLSTSSAFSYTFPTPTSPPSSLSHIPLTPNQKVYAIGDVHGSLKKLLHALTVAKLVKIPEGKEDEIVLKDVEWIGGDSLLVQCGDVLDRGSFECACFHLLAVLSRKAAEEGGGVVLCLGNHEVLNTLGLFNYADKGGNEEFERIFGDFFDAQSGSESWRLNYAGNQPARWRACEPGGAFSSFGFLNNFVLATQIGRSVFVHGGLTKEHLEEYGGIEGMNEKARRWFEEEVYRPEVGEEEKVGGEVKDIVACAQNRARAIQSSMPEFLGGGSPDTPSPVWMRDYSSPADSKPGNDSANKLLQNALDTIGGEAARMVVGHTPQSRINSACGGKVWRIDVGMSEGVMNNMPEMLEIVHGEVEDTVTVISTREGRVAAGDRTMESQGGEKGEKGDSDIFLRG
ncbi:hypothetical protein TrLO_g15477 [Triparma laevis f. longispina]|uniref:Calcineurin-like phosphoesterase domain-containing protein n=1 Tax=Triparma laevis f. longispina TaxID=1714387 RepID=A0A9W7F8D7_9STRA|nr:hypothetical protein TrLO_g15477 [Triparma laevis f. longispina]